VQDPEFKTPVPQKKRMEGREGREERGKKGKGEEREGRKEGRKGINSFYLILFYLVVLEEGGK
jgi:hypothetical protein